MVSNILFRISYVFKYLVWTSQEIKEVDGILGKPALKCITTETLHLLINVYEDVSLSRQVPEKKDYVSVSEGVHKQKLCKLQESL